MKLLVCLACGDIFNLVPNKPKSCSCGDVSGHYINNREAVVNGNGFSLAMGSGSIIEAIQEVQQQLTHNSAPNDLNRDWWKNNNQILCWARPHSGPGNPHTTVKKDDGCICQGFHRPRHCPVHGDRRG